MNLYIISNVLYDYTSGMVVIAAADQERCRAIFEVEFPRFIGEYDSAIINGSYEVLQVVDQQEGLVSYVFGGG